MQAYLGIFSVVLGLVGFSFYFRNIFRRETKPHMFSWLIWSLTTGIAFFGQLVEGAGAGAWVTGSTTILCFSVFLLSFRYGEKNRTKMDWVSLTIALGALFLWFITKEPLLSVVLVTLVDVVGTFPTIRKSWVHPWEETLTLFCLEGVKFLIGLFALQTLSLVTMLYPIGAMGTNIALLFVILWGRYVLKKKR